MKKNILLALGFIVLMCGTGVASIMPGQLPGLAEEVRNQNKPE